MASKYNDTSAVIQIIGNIYRNPELLEMEDKYFFSEDDFTDSFHKLIFGIAYNLWFLGIKEITIPTVEDYLKDRPKQLAEYTENKGAEYILKCKDNANPLTFNYYYDRLKKMTLLRCYSTFMDVSWLYDVDNIFDTAKRQQQEDWFDNTSLSKMSEIIQDKIDEVKAKCVDNTLSNGTHISEGIRLLLNSLEETPAYGIPLYGKYMNTVTRGARLGKFFLRSAATGVGKTRSMIADACYCGCCQIYDTEKAMWVSTGKCQPTLYIATEQDLSEVQSMCLAFLSGVDEEHILVNEYAVGERERVIQAVEVLESSKLMFECTPDFSLKDIENIIKHHIRENEVQYVFYDYIHVSMKILEEITKRSGGVKLREDNVLFMLATKLKEICVQYNIFIMSSTQLNMSYQDSETPDQNLLRGAKSIADRIDWGSILLEVTKEDKEKLQPILTQTGMGMPNVKLSIYKSRQGRWKGIYLWIQADRGSCRFNPMFATKFDFELVSMDDIKIKTEEEPAF